MEIQIELISKNIRSLREEHDFTQEELAKALGVSRQSIIALEQGRCLPSLPLAISLAEAFDMAFENIFYPTQLNKIQIETNQISSWSSMKELNSLHDTIDHLFEESFPVSKAIAMPVINVYDRQNSVVVEAEVPGVKEEDLNIEVGDDHLIIRGEKKTENEVKEKDFYRRESSYGSFSRTIPLPVGVDKEKTEAELRDGVLKVILPKIAEIKPKTTKIKVKRG